MTKEESIAKMAELRAEAEALTKDFNDANQCKRYEDAGKADEAIVGKVNEYTAIARNLCFMECRESADPMLTAVTRLNYTTIGVKDAKTGEDKIPVRSIVEKEKAIDLLKLHKFCGEIGADKHWNDYAQKLNFLLTIRTAKDLKVDPKEIISSYAMSDYARQLNMGKNPDSNTNLLRTLQTVVSAMIGGDYKASSHDVAFLKNVYAKKGRKALSVACATHRYLREYLAAVCNRIVTNGSYGVEYKAKKES